MSAGRKKVLVVDDKPAIRESLRIQLTSAGYDVQLETNGAEGLAAALSQSFDLIVTDVWMPELDGIEMMKRIRVDKPGQRCLLISGGRPHMPSHSSLVLAEAYGADAVLHKPFANEALLQKVNEILAA